MTVAAALTLAAVPLLAVAARLDADRWAAAVAAVLSVEGALLVVSVTVAPSPTDLVSTVPHGLVLALLPTVLVALPWSGRRGTATLAAGLVLLTVHHSASLLGASVVAAGACLAGAAVVVVGAARRLRRILVRLDAERDAQDEELRLSELRRVRAAERDHELRNGLAGLAGATRLLGSAQGDADGDHLDELVASELRRLHALLQSPESPRPQGPARIYTVEPVLRGLVALRRAAGTDVRLEADPDVCAVGSSEVLAQVVVNLLANAERHAPGSPIWLASTLRRGQVLVEVRDAGPGVGAGREELVLEPGVRDRRGGGRGLGLHLCRHLMAGQDGTITVTAVDPAAPGCHVVLALPAAAYDGAAPVDGDPPTAVSVRS